ncbi:4Fe-4S dicluster domain-containing protein [bacterium]|nr:4Fe-4S dicluster domain-containing protein [bacterium]
MVAEKYYIDKSQWESIARDWLKQHEIIAPQQETGGLFFQPVHRGNLHSVVYHLARSVQPLKTFLLPPLEEVVGHPVEMKKPWLFLGVKACDLQALPILAQAFGGDFADAAFQKRLQDSVIISCDCTEPWDTCFCTMVGGKPYPEKGYDLNLIRVSDGFVVEVGSLRGKGLLEGHESMLKDVLKEDKMNIEQSRSEIEKRVIAQNAKYPVKGILRELVGSRWESPAWSEHAKTCVECGACNHACPTCHCYFLDDVTRKAFVKLRGWDSCMYSGYAVTAGGGTPRPALVERFRNRYFCKFKYLPENYGQLGCTGCGRCIEGCQGQIDMRSTLKDLSGS